MACLDAPPRPDRPIPSTPPSTPVPLHPPPHLQVRTVLGGVPLARVPGAAQIIPGAVCRVRERHPRDRSQGSAERVREDRQVAAGRVALLNRCVGSLHFESDRKLVRSVNADCRRCYPMSRRAV